MSWWYSWYNQRNTFQIISTIFTTLLLKPKAMRSDDVTVLLEEVWKPSEPSTIQCPILQGQLHPLIFRMSHESMRSKMLPVSPFHLFSDVSCLFFDTTRFYTLLFLKELPIHNLKLFQAEIASSSHWRKHLPNHIQSDQSIISKKLHQSLH